MCKHFLKLNSNFIEITYIQEGIKTPKYNIYLYKSGINQKKFSNY